VLKSTNEFINSSVINKFMIGINPNSIFNKTIIIKLERLH